MLILLIIALSVHCGFYLFLFSSLIRYKESERRQDKRAVSVLVCYHNEEDNIEENLPALLEQNAEEFVLVDDCSEDSTYEKLEEYRSAKTRVLTLKEQSTGKKAAFYHGITNAKNDFVLLTDADCKPSSGRWAEIMSTYDSKFVLGYGPMVKKRGIVSLFSRYETYITAIQYLSFALYNMPYMGVGRNLGIDRKYVIKNWDQIKGQNLASGDDDLMINALANGSNTRICIHRDTFMYSAPKTTWTSFLRQKTRHIGTSVHYKFLHKLLLSLYSGSHIAFYLVLIIGLISGTISLILALKLLVVKWLIQFVINIFVMSKLKESDLIWKFPFLDILHFLYLCLLPVYLLIKKKNTWN